MEMETQSNVTGGYHDNSGVSSPAVGVISGVETMLRKFHAGYFRIGMSVGCQTLLWKIMAGKNQDLLHPTILTVLWSMAFFLLFCLSLFYLLRCLFHFRLVQCEFLHHVGVNYLFAPWISWFLLLQSAPFLPPRATLYKVLLIIYIVYSHNIFLKTNDNTFCNLISQNEFEYIQKIETEIVGEV